MDDGRLGEFQQVQMSSFLTSYIATDVDKGYTYRFRYRIANVNGHSPYSEVSYIYPFSVPDAPAKPVFVSATQESVTLSFTESLDNNGVDIIGYELWIDEGDDTLSEFSKVDSYSGFQETHTLTKATDGLGDPGTIYRVKFRAVNEENDYSEFSNELIFALGSLPTTPDPPTKIIEESSIESIMVSWDEVTTDSLPILGYNLYADSGQKDTLKLVYNGKNRASTTTYLFTAADISDDTPTTLSSLLHYRFQVTALNFNGESAPSSIALI